jgi:pyoverdine/dityrosine biosynthesis protein Dit1
MRAIRFGGECPASIVAKKRQLRKRAEEVNVKVNFFTTGSTKEHRVRAHRVKQILPAFPCSSFPCSSVLLW